MADHGHGSGHASRKSYMVVFAVLTVLTVLEVAVASPSLGLDRKVVGATLVAMAISKAAIVGYFYMHLKQELSAMKKMVVIPFFFPALYAVVLILEASWRLSR